MLGLDLNRQNTLVATNPKGQTVRCGKPRNSDLTGMLPDGRKLDIEVKKEGFNPHKIYGEEKIRFEKQMARLELTNAQDGVAFWTDDSEQCMRWLRFFMDGGRVEKVGYEQHVFVRRKAETKEGCDAGSTRNESEVSLELEGDQPPSAGCCREK
jgi:hypothetical protein